MPAFGLPTLRRWYTTRQPSRHRTAGPTSRRAIKSTSGWKPTSDFHANVWRVAVEVVLSCGQRAPRMGNGLPELNAGPLHDGRRHAYAPGPACQPGCRCAWRLGVARPHRWSMAPAWCVGWRMPTGSLVGGSWRSESTPPWRSWTNGPNNGSFPSRLTDTVPTAFVGGEAGRARVP